MLYYDSVDVRKARLVLDEPHCRVKVISVQRHAPWSWEELMTAVDQIGAIGMSQALCESDLSSNHTVGQLRRCGRVVAYSGTRDPMTVPACRPVDEGRAMCRSPSWVRIESYDKTSADGVVLLSLVRISLSNTLYVRRRPEPWRPLP